jgi:Cu(I)-responsive transcriptional regulator
MNIGEAARRSGLSAKMIRYYESVGVLPPPRRSAGGYRVYEAGEVQALVFVRRARDLGFPVARIAELLRLWADPERASADVKALAEAQVSALRGRIGELHQMVEVLESLAARCPGDAGADCPILDDLAPAPTSPSSPDRP